MSLHKHAHHGPTSTLYALLSALIGLAGFALFLYLRRLFHRVYPTRPSANRRQSEMAAPNVDLVIVFRGASQSTVKAKIRADAKGAEDQYTRLLSTLKQGGLYATGRRGANPGQILVFISCPNSRLVSLVGRERYSDFMYGLPTTNLASVADTSDSAKLAPADRLRLINDYIASTTEEGGLGIIVGLPQWNRVESVMALQDHDFNHEWIKSWSTHRVGDKELDGIRDQFGESIALYFSFLSAYSRFLVFPAVLGVATFWFGSPYSTTYSTLLALWAVTFVEYWRVRERVLSVRWRTRGSFRVERKRAQFDSSINSLRRDLRTSVSVPVILLFAGILATLLTAIFVFEAFITQLYTGPGRQYIGFVPTVVFMVLVPRFMALYQSAAVKLTWWENHAQQSAHEASLTVKTFSLSAVVAYLGLALSAFVYVPFGGDVMARVQTFLFKNADHPLAAGTHTAAHGFATAASTVLNTTTNVTGAAKDGTAPGDRTLFEADALSARARLNPSRLQDQMFAITVTNQVINTFLEVGLPYVMRAFGRASNMAKKRGATETDEADADAGVVERRLLERVRTEVALPEYALFADYSEMVTQFGHIALWSTIWPLAPVMALLNNLLEIRADAFKITVHQRRPVPVRSDTIGPWLSALEGLAWAAALTNAALVYLFRPQSAADPRTTTLNEDHPYTAEALGRAPQSTRELLIGAATVALVASHGAILARAVIRHVLVRTLWSADPRVADADRVDRQAKQEYMDTIGLRIDGGVKGQAALPSGGAFWENDEGLDEVRRGVKDA